MSYKITCPACNTTTTDNTRGFQDDGACPTCGLSSDVLHEVWRVRESHANDVLKSQVEALLVRAGKAEAERDTLKEKLERIREQW